MHLVGDGKNRFEADALLTYATRTARVSGRKSRRIQSVEDGPMKPRGLCSRILVLAPISHMALTLAGKKPISLHSNTTIRSLM